MLHVLKTIEEKNTEVEDIREETSRDKNIKSQFKKYTGYINSRLHIAGGKISELEERKNPTSSTGRKETATKTISSVTCGAHTRQSGVCTCGVPEGGRGPEEHRK